MADNDTTYVYLIHFNTPLHHARHYLGSCKSIPARMKAHRGGNGSRLTEVIKEKGIGFKLARVWLGGRKKERYLKAHKNAPRYCPYCTKDFRKG